MGDYLSHVSSAFGHAGKRGLASYCAADARFQAKFEQNQPVSIDIVVRHFFDNSVGEVNACVRNTA